MKPTVGRIVHFIDNPKNDPLAAIVTAVGNGGSLSLCVFYPTEPKCEQNIQFDATGLKSRTWHWPERV